MNEVKNYKIEYKILTLAHCAVMDNKVKPASFEVEGIEFSHWDFNYTDGWRTDTDAWVASSEIQSRNFIEAINIFTKKLSRMVPRISLICQSYIEFAIEPFLIHEVSKNIVFFKYIEDVRGGGLMFMEKERKALTKLLEIKEVPETFYYYWNDAVNATGHSSKLLMMFSALEAFARNRNKKIFKKPIDLFSEILGPELSLEIFADGNGLRNRLVHGEYFKDDDNNKNYLEVIHNKVISYFNNKILPESLIQGNIVHPQRHFFGNKKEGRWFVKRKDGSNSFSLKDLLNDFNKNGFRTPKDYEIVFDTNLGATY